MRRCGQTEPVPRWLGTTRRTAATSTCAKWGEPGTNGQHAFFQQLHQGTDVVPVEFILVRTPTAGLLARLRA